MKVALASKSPSRKEIIEDMGLKFEIINSNFDEESISKKLPPEEYVKACAEGKIRMVLNPELYDLIIFADTICWRADKLYNAPTTDLEAKSILRVLSNKKHNISTYLGIWMPKKDIKLTRLVKTVVELKKLSEKEIEYYISSKEPIGKAGAYAIQGVGKKYVKRYKGSYYNIRGLPKETLIILLQKCGVKI